MLSSLIRGSSFTPLRIVGFVSLFSDSDESVILRTNAVAQDLLDPAIVKTTVIYMNPPKKSGLSWSHNYIGRLSFAMNMPKILLHHVFIPLLKKFHRLLPLQDYFAINARCCTSLVVPHIKLIVIFLKNRRKLTGLTGMDIFLDSSASLSSNTLEDKLPRFSIMFILATTVAR